MEDNLGPRPESHTLDRIDSGKPYEPGNIRWASKSQQSYNRAKYTGNGRLCRQLKSGRWNSKFTWNGQTYSAGTFDTQEEAYNASVNLRNTL